MILRIGGGSFRTSVGMATIWSSLASRGFSMRSITSISNSPARCSSQMSLEIGEGRDGLRCLPGDVQAQLPLLRLLRLHRFTVRIGLRFHLRPFFGDTWNPLESALRLRAIS